MSSHNGGVCSFATKDCPVGGVWRGQWGQLAKQLTHTALGEGGQGPRLALGTLHSHRHTVLQRVGKYIAHISHSWQPGAHTRTPDGQ